MFRHFRSHHKRRDPLIRNLAASYSSELLTIYLGRRIEACPLSQSWPGYFNRASKFGEQPPSLRMATNTLLYGHYARRCVFRKCFISVVGIVSTPAAACQNIDASACPAVSDAAAVVVITVPIEVVKGKAGTTLGARGGIAGWLRSARKRSAPKSNMPVLSAAS
jgi:hypothetical protein